MKRLLARLLASSFLLAWIGVTGCQGSGGLGPEAPEDEDGDGIGYVVLEALARQGGVRLRWIQEYPNGPDLYYRVTWKPVSPEGIVAGDTGTQFVYWFDDPDDLEGDSKMFTTEIFELSPKLYEFRLDVMRRGEPEALTHTTMKAAPAQRFYYEANGDEPIRLHEEASLSARSGLVIDPVNGARSVRLIDAQPGSVHLALVRGGTGELVLQIASTTQWGESGKADPAFITFPDDARAYREMNFWAPLDDWWFSPPGPIDARGWVASGRYIFVQNGGRGLFLLGDPTSTEWRFVRVSTVRGDVERYIRGVAPERYVELEISVGYPGVPFA